MNRQTKPQTNGKPFAFVSPEERKTRTLLKLDLLIEAKMKKCNQAERVLDSERKDLAVLHAQRYAVRNGERVALPDWKNLASREFTRIIHEQGEDVQSLLLLLRDKRKKFRLKKGDLAEGVPCTRAEVATELGKRDGREPYHVKLVQKRLRRVRHLITTESRDGAGFVFWIPCLDEWETGYAPDTLERLQPDTPEASAYPVQNEQSRTA